MQGNQYSYMEIEAFCSRFYRDANGKPLSLLITPYGYPLIFTDSAPGDVDTKTLNIAANADFVLLAMHSRALVTGATDTLTVETTVVPDCSVFITDSGTGENFTNSQVDLANFTSIGYFQALAYPRILSGKSSLSVQLTNYGATDTYSRVELFFDGVQVRAYAG